MKDHERVSRLKDELDSPGADVLLHTSLRWLRLQFLGHLMLLFPMMLGSLLKSIHTETQLREIDFKTDFEAPPCAVIGRNLIVSDLDSVINPTQGCQTCCRCGLGKLNIIFFLTFHVV